MQGRTSTIGGRRFTNLKDDDATGRRREKKRPQSPQEEDATARKKKRPQPTDSVEVEEEVRGERREVQEKREKLSLLRGKVPPRVRVFLRKLCISFLLCALMYLYIARSGT